MISRSLGTALLLSAVAILFGGGGCSSGGDDDKFFVQTWSDAAPNTNLAEFLDQADGEKISITQHTGSMTLSDANIDAIVDFLFFDGDPPDLSESTLGAIADGSDKNPAYFMVTDTANNDFIFNIASTGDLDMVLLSDEAVDTFILAVTKDEEPDIIVVVNDPVVNVAALVATMPGEDAPHFGTLDYMSVVAWATTVVPDEGATEITVDFGLGHMGLVTPAADIPTEGDAIYVGNFAGIYVEPGTGYDGFVGVVTGDAAFTADFGDGTVEGGVLDIEFAGITLTGDEFSFPAGDIDFEGVTISGNTFSGSVVPGGDGILGFDPASTGTLDGNFYGPVISDGPEEAGVVLTLQDASSDEFVTGVIGAKVLD